MSANPGTTQSQSSLQISKSSLDAFLCRVEEAYQTHSNPYHNSTHAADVLQTVHCVIVTTNLSVSTIVSIIITVLLCAGMVEQIGTTSLAVCCRDPRR